MSNMALKRKGGTKRQEAARWAELHYEMDGESSQYDRDEKCIHILVRYPQIIHLGKAGVRGRIILQQKYDGNRSWTELAKGTER
jgi:hypothetical protein